MEILIHIYPSLMPNHRRTAIVPPQHRWAPNSISQNISYSVCHTGIQITIHNPSLFIQNLLQFRDD
jgi:hypothetical protein